MGTKSTRDFKVGWILTRVRSAAIQGLVMNEEELISDFCLFNSTARRTCTEILHNLSTMKKIIRNDGELWTPEAWEHQIELEKSDNPLKLLEEAKQKKAQEIIEKDAALREQGATD